MKRLLLAALAIVWAAPALAASNDLPLVIVSGQIRQIPAADSLLIPTLVGTGTRCVQASSTGVMSATASACGSGSGSGTVTSVSVVTANGVSGSVATATTTPAITLTLGAITPSSVNASGTVAGSNLSGTNTGDQTITLTGDVTGSGTGSFAATIASNAVTTTKINNSAVTLAKIANAAASSKLLGSGASGSGSAYSEITLGTNLSMSGTTLNASGGGGSGTVTSVATGTGLTGGTITTTGTLALSGATVPQGRLTLVTGVPVMTSDQTAKATVYYDCYRGKLVPYYDGSTDQVEAISACEVSTAMQASSTGVLNSVGVFDVWWVHSGASRICVATNGSGGGWASDTAGSNTARGTGYSQVHNTRGYWTNVNAVPHCYNGATDYGSVSADQATYLGTLYTTAAGQTGMAFKPTGAAGGTNNVLGLWNAYNRVRVTARAQDSTSSWSYGTGTWRASDNSSSNRVNFIDGLQQSPLETTFQQLISGTASGMTIGISLDSTSATPDVQAGAWTTCTPLVKGLVTAQLGLHYLQAQEWAGATVSFWGGTYYSLMVSLDM